MSIENTHFKCPKSYYRDSGVEVTHLFLECDLLEAHNFFKFVKKR